MRYLFTILLMILVPSKGWASGPESAAQMLSRFPPGHVPASIPVLNAMGVLEESGDLEHISLLESMIDGESREIQEAATLALAGISSRGRHALRKNFSEPTSEQIHALGELLRNESVHLGPHERQALAYAVLVLEKIPDNVEREWRLSGMSQEDAADAQGALRTYALAAANGHIEALEEIRAYGVDPERLVLGLWTAWCPEQTDTTTTLEILVRVGSIQTVRVLANRALRATAYHRAIALDALSQMLADGKLSRTAVSAARHGLESGMRDPHDDVRQLARAALLELKPH